MKGIADHSLVIGKSLQIVAGLGLLTNTFAIAHVDQQKVAEQGVMSVFRDLAQKVLNPRSLSRLPLAPKVRADRVVTGR